jgi:hypothetical protein
VRVSKACLLADTKMKSRPQQRLIDGSAAAQRRCGGAARTRGFAAPAFAGCPCRRMVKLSGTGTKPIKHLPQGETTVS